MSIPKPTTPINISPDFAYDAVVLAGGRGTRMSGRDKGWVRWQGLPLIEQVLERLKKQTVPPTRIIISANRNTDTYSQTGHMVMTDDRPDYLGPLAGIETALLRCKQPFLLVVPCDMPSIPLHIAEKLHSSLEASPKKNAAYTTTSTGTQPLCCLLKKSVTQTLSRSLDRGHGKVIAWLDGIEAIPVHFEESAAFINFNDLNMLQAMDAQQ